MIAAIVLDDARAGEVEPRLAEPGGGERDDDLAAVRRDPQGLRPDPAEVHRRVDVARRDHDDPLALDEGWDVLRVLLDVDDLLEVRARRVVRVQALERLQERGLRTVPSPS